MRPVAHTRLIKVESRGPGMGVLQKNCWPRAGRLSRKVMSRGMVNNETDPCIRSVKFVFGVKIPGDVRN